MIYDIILNDIKQAMLDKNNVKRDCLRTVISDIKNQTVNAGKELTEDICLSVIKKSVKQHNDSIESFKLGNREDLVMKETMELLYLNSYLPKMYSENELDTIVLEIVDKNGIELLKSNMGKVMKLLNEREDKSLIDKKYVSQFLNYILK